MHSFPLSASATQQEVSPPSELPPPPAPATFVNVPVALSSAAVSLQLFRKDHTAMATTFSLLLYAPSQATADAAADHAFCEIDRVENLLSRFREGSEISRLNREAFAAPVTTDPETFRFLENALRWSARSEGAFDLTVGHLMRAWGFLLGSGHLPTEHELAIARDAVGWHKVRLYPESRTVRLLSPTLELDPGGIGKGYAVDRAVRTLRRHGISSALLSAGSSTIYALGAPAGHPGWNVRVPVPDHPNETLSSVSLCNTSLSTASPAEKHFTTNGRRYGHIMDPRTLQPVSHTAQVSVIAPSATDSDALSNALFVLGPELGRPLVHTEPHASALVLTTGPNGTSPHPIHWPTPVSESHSIERRLERIQNESTAAPPNTLT